MNNALNRYFAVRLVIYDHIKKIKPDLREIDFNDILHLHEKLAFYINQLIFLRGLLSHQNAHIDDIRRGLINLGEAQYAAILNAKENPPDTAYADVGEVLHDMSNFYWIASACICSLGQDVAVLTVKHLDEETISFLRRMLAINIHRLKKQPLKTHLDVVDFLDSCLTLNRHTNDILQNSGFADLPLPYFFYN